MWDAKCARNFKHSPVLQPFKICCNGCPWLHRPPRWIWFRNGPACCGCTLACLTVDSHPCNMFAGWTRLSMWGC
eukprot:28464-Amphidinium_carterae.1